MLGTLTAVAVAAVGAGLYFANGMPELASGFQSENRPNIPLPTASPTPQTARRSIVIGKWADRIGTSWTQEIRIVVYAGQVFREAILADGRVDRDILTEVPPHADEEMRFENPSSTHGQAYAITRHGHLAIFDSEGFVHQATKVTTKGEKR